MDVQAIYESLTSAKVYAARNAQVTEFSLAIGISS